jgi:hypothetical protein
MAKKKYSLDVFKSHFVEIVTTVQISASTNSDEAFVERVQPMVIAGIFLDHDEQHVYIGDEEGKLSDTLNKNHCVHIGVSKKKDKLDDLLDSGPDTGSFN